MFDKLPTIANYVDLEELGKVEQLQRELTEAKAELYRKQEQLDIALAALHHIARFIDHNGGGLSQEALQAVCALREIKELEK